MLTFVVKSLEAKIKVDLPGYLKKLKSNVGDLSEEEQLSEKILVRFTWF